MSWDILPCKFIWTNLKKKNTLTSFMFLLGDTLIQKSPKTVYHLVYICCRFGALTKHQATQNRQTIHQNLSCWLVLAIAMLLFFNSEREENLPCFSTGSICCGSNIFLNIALILYLFCGDLYFYFSVVSYLINGITWDVSNVQNYGCN